jgi:AmmeMemoRadiSam system protein A
VTAESPHDLVAAHGDRLIAIAEEAIGRRLSAGATWAPAPGDLPPALLSPRACFVTLKRDGDLLGCVGTFAPTVALGVTVAGEALDAAFADPRFGPLDGADFEAATITVSVLSELEPLPVHSYAELVAALHPDIDGVLVEAAGHRATFLPAVWPTLRSPEAFVDALWTKAGLTHHAWSSALHVFRYVTAEAHGFPPRHFGTTRAL